MTRAVSGNTIERSDFGSKAPSRDLGTLEVALPEGRRALPLAGVDIKARVADRVADVTIKQTFRNTYTEHLEAVYTFPMSGSSTVTSFEMHVKDRVIKAEIKERAEAQKEYRQAIQDGKRAALLEQERENIFTVKVGNLPPGEEITVNITYCERLPVFEDGAAEIRLPLVVAPRYIPGEELERDPTGTGTGFDTDVVPDASRITPPMLANGFDPKTNLSISVSLLKGKMQDKFAVKDISCSQHAVSTSLDEGVVEVTLAREDELLNRDFVLRWGVASESIKSSLFVYTDKDGASYGMLTLFPPRKKGFLGVARDVVFVVDRSGSMQGIKMTSAARACSILLDSLTPRDRFAILAFDDMNEWMNLDGQYFQPVDRLFLPADETGIQKGKDYLRGITARGGTEMERAIQGAMSEIAQRQNKDASPIIVLLTDGQIGDESRVLKRLQMEIGDSRLFAIGIDTAVNDGLLKRLANAGGGTSTFVTPGARLEEALITIAREIGAPLVTNIKLEAVKGDIDKASITPDPLLDLFQGRAATCFFKLSEPFWGKGVDGKDVKVRLTGRVADGGKFNQEVSANPLDLKAIASLWAKGRIQDLEDEFRIDQRRKPKLKNEIISLSVAHSVLSKLTAYVVVDHSEIVNTTGERRTVVQPVHQPAQWEMTPDAQNLPLAGAFGQPAGLPARSASSLMGQLVKQSYSQPLCDSTGWGAPAGGGGSADSWGAPPPPAAPQPAPGFVDGAASYGSGVRSQVFEVIVRQAIDGAPWREICAGPMQVNNISEEEVEQEVARRQKLGGSGGQGGSTSSKQKPATSGVKGLTDEIKKAAFNFSKVLCDAWTAIESGAGAQAEAIEKARLALLKELATSTLGTELRELQRFLRVECVELIAAIRAGNAGPDELKEIVQKHRLAFENVKPELELIETGKEKVDRYWENNI